MIKFKDYMKKENVLDEANKGSVAKHALKFNDDDRTFLYQFPKELWGEAIYDRYNIQLYKYLKEREDRRKKIVTFYKHDPKNQSLDSIKAQLKADHPGWTNLAINAEAKDALDLNTVKYADLTAPLDANGEYTNDPKKIKFRGLDSFLRNKYDNKTYTFDVDEKLDSKGKNQGFQKYHSSKGGNPPLVFHDVKYRIPDLVEKLEQGYDRKRGYDLSDPKPSTSESGGFTFETPSYSSPSIDEWRKHVKSWIEGLGHGFLQEKMPESGNDYMQLDDIKSNLDITLMENKLKKTIASFIGKGENAANSPIELAAKINSLIHSSIPNKYSNNPTDFFKQVASDYQNLFRIKERKIPLDPLVKNTPDEALRLLTKNKSLENAFINGVTRGILVKLADAGKLKANKYTASNKKDHHSGWLGQDITFDHENKTFVSPNISVPKKRLKLKAKIKDANGNLQPNDFEITTDVPDLKSGDHVSPPDPGAEVDPSHYRGLHWNPISLQYEPQYVNSSEHKPDRPINYQGTNDIGYGAIYPSRTMSGSSHLQGNDPDFNIEWKKVKELFGPPCNITFKKDPNGNIEDIVIKSDPNGEYLMSLAYNLKKFICTGEKGSPCNLGKEVITNYVNGKEKKEISGAYEKIKLIKQFIPAYDYLVSNVIRLIGNERFMDVNDDSFRLTKVKQWLNNLMDKNLGRGATKDRNSEDLTNKDDINNYLNRMSKQKTDLEQDVYNKSKIRNKPEFAHLEIGDKNVKEDLIRRLQAYCFKKIRYNRTATSKTFFPANLIFKTREIANTISRIPTIPKEKAPEIVQKKIEKQEEDVLNAAIQNINNIGKETHTVDLVNDIVKKILATNTDDKSKATKINNKAIEIKDTISKLFATSTNTEESDVEPQPTQQPKPVEQTPQSTTPIEDYIHLIKTNNSVTTDEIINQLDVEKHGSIASKIKSLPENDKTQNLLAHMEAIETLATAVKKGSFIPSIARKFSNLNNNVVNAFINTISNSSMADNKKAQAIKAIERLRKTNE